MSGNSVTQEAVAYIDLGSTGMLVNATLHGVTVKGERHEQVSGCVFFGPCTVQPLGEKPAAGREAVEYTVSHVSPMNFGGFCAQIITSTKIEPGTKLYAAPVAAAPVDGPDVHSFDPTEARATVTLRWPDGVCLGYQLNRGVYTDQLPTAPAAPGIDLRNALQKLREDALHMKDPGDTVNAYDRVLRLIDASPKGGSDELKVWGTQKPGSMPKLFGVRHIAELNWYPDEGYDLVCMQVIERVQATSAEVVS